MGKLWGYMRATTDKFIYDELSIIVWNFSENITWKIVKNIHCEGPADNICIGIRGFGIKYVGNESASLFNLVQQLWTD